MIFALGVLMVVAAFRPWLRFETMLFCTAEKCFIAYLFLSNLGQPWVMGYFGGFVVDSTIAAYGIHYFLSDQGRPARTPRARLRIARLRISTVRAGRATSRRCWP